MEIARVLALIGSIVALIGWILQLIGGITNIPGDVYAIIGIIISILILASLGYVKIKTFIPFTWWMVLIFAIIQAFLGVGWIGLTGLGVILEIIAAIVLLINYL